MPGCASATRPEKWPGLPRGVKFDPTDEELLWHLLAQTGEGEAEPHPFIGEFIVSLDRNDEISHSFPHKLPGVKQDGSLSFFFHRAFKVYGNRGRKCRKKSRDASSNVCWLKIGKTEPVFVDGTRKGWKKTMVLFMNMSDDEKLEKTNWMMHQYHVGMGMDVEGKLVISKIFYAVNSGLGVENVSVGTAGTVGKESEAAISSKLTRTRPHPQPSSLISMEVPSQGDTYNELEGNTPLAKEVSDQSHKPGNDGIDNFTLQERYTSMLSGMNLALSSQNNSEFSQDIQQSGTGFTQFSRTSEVNMREQRRETPLDHLEARHNNISQADNSCLRPNVVEECSRGMVKYEIDPAIAHTLPGNSRLCSPLDRAISSLDQEASERHPAVDQSSPGPSYLNVVPGASLSGGNLESDKKLLCLASNSEVKLPVISQDPGNVNDADTATCCRGAPSLLEATSPDDSLSGRCKSQQYLEGSCRGSDESCISRATQVDSIQGLQNHTDSNNSNYLIPTVFPLEVKAEPAEESYRWCSTNENPEELLGTHQTDLTSNKNLPSLSLSPCLFRSKVESAESGLLVSCDASPSTSLEVGHPGPIVKRECVDEFSEDPVDHIPLRERMRMLKSMANTELSSRKRISNALPPSECGSSDAVNTKTRNSSLRKKRKKTATNCVETALEEDAPGLLQVLLDKGVTVDEIKLYGKDEDDEAISLWSSEDSFKELESVIAKLFSEGPSILTLPTLRQIKGSKAVYCLACLISLIEQARYLRFRESPVEWGWCRDLQSFIFVFERHNRIVLERPEYGYATYFFELVESLPIGWQVKRLVTAMKLPCCSRTILLENKPLLVGEDLSEGEARVMEEYGWIRNSGLGSLLNYCDRVVHDRRDERYSSEWRAKIVKLLMRGHDGGRTVLLTLPKKAIPHSEQQYPEKIKLET